MNLISLWSLRFSPSFGWHWRQERQCDDRNQEAWLTAFRKDEPEITFVCARKAPKVPKGLKSPRVCTCDRLTAPEGWEKSDHKGHYPDCASLND